MSNINKPINEAINRFDIAIHGIQVEYEFLSRYLTEEQKEIYAKSFVNLEELSYILHDIKEN